MPRLFLAVPMDDQIRARLVDMRTRLSAADADIRWVAPENLHLTVAFLGDRGEGQVPDIASFTEHVAANTAAFRIELCGGSAFPKKGPLKTLWVGIGEGAAAWKDLARLAEKTFAPFGVPPRNDLTPHITIGRVRGERNMDELRARLVREAQTDCGAQSAEKLELVESTLDPGGATYRTRGSWRFAATASSPKPLQ